MKRINKLYMGDYADDAMENDMDDMINDINPDINTQEDEDDYNERHMYD